MLELGTSTKVSAAASRRLILRARKTGHEITLPTGFDGDQLQCIVDGKSIGHELGSAFVGLTVWDVVAEGNRLRAGQTDITDPRSVFKFGWVRAKSGDEIVKIRPYWTLDGYLSLEINLTTSAAMPNNP